MDVLNTSRFLVVGGGGTKGIAFASALHDCATLYERATGANLFSRFVGLAGTSVGSLVTFAIAAGASPKDMRSLASQLASPDSPRLLDGVNPFRFAFRGGACDRSFLVATVEDLMATLRVPLEATFSDFYRMTGRTWACNASDVAGDSILLFSHVTTPSVGVRNAMVMSCCVPYVFEPVVHDGRVVVDGAVLAPVLYPGLFPEEETLVVMSDPHQRSPPPAPPARSRIGAFSLPMDITWCQTSRLISAHFDSLSPVLRRRILAVQSPQDVSTLQATPREAVALWRAGEEAARSFLGSRG